MSNKINKFEVVERLNGLAQDRAAWENGSYKVSSEELYLLLDRCCTLMEQMKGQTKLVSELNDLLVEKGITFNDGTSLATKVARFVFNGNNKRITGYARVLRVAAEEKQENVNRRSIGTPYRRAKGTPFALRGSVDAGRRFRAAGGAGRA